MELDFLGLNRKQLVSAVKEETVESNQDPVFIGGPGVQWDLSNKVSAMSHLMSFKTTQEEMPNRIMYDPASSSAFHPISQANTHSGISQANMHSGISQKVLNLGRQGGNLVAQPYPFHTYNAAHRANELRTFPHSNHSFSVAMANPFFKIHNSVGVHNEGTNLVKQQSLGGIHITNTHPADPLPGSVVGTYAPRNILKPVASPSQLTIFYAGTVTVYNEISPEKAQAIMSLAGNGLSGSGATSKAQVPSSSPKHVVGEGFHGNHSHVPSPCSGHSSPTSVNSHSGSQSVVASNNTDDMTAMKTSGTLVSRGQPEPPNIITSVGPTTGALMQAAVPQARKASLARFLEKRKGRVTNAGPYSCKKPLEDVSRSDVAGLAGKTPMTSVALTIGKEL